MIRPLLSTVALLALMGGAVNAETIEVKMLNKSGSEMMVFEPDFVRAAPGDTIRFVATDKGHNAESIEGMIPEGAEAFSGKLNKDTEITVSVDGLYAVRCKPHYAMGMVMLIAVGDVVTPDGYLEGRVPKKAKERFEAALNAM